MTEYVRQQVEMLRRDGYADAADIIVRQDSQFNLVKEFEYMAEFAAGNDSGDLLTREQLRALWTTYCIHIGAAVDTALYDSDLRRIWAQVTNAGQARGYRDFDDFDDFMCGLLV